MALRTTLSHAAELIGACLHVGLANVIRLQFFLIVFMAVYALVNSFARNCVERRSKAYKEVFAGELVTELCALLEGEPPQFALVRRAGLQRKVAKDHLLEQIRIFNGLEREFLVGRYLKYGFYAEDIRECETASWAKRLRALVRLGYLEYAELAPLFGRMMGDRDPIVAVAAALALSVLDHPLNDVTLIERLPLKIRSRRDVLNEVILNFGERHGVPGLVHAARATGDPMIVDGCVRALIQLKSVECVPVLRPFLNPDLNLDPRLVCDLLAGLEAVGDPSVIPYVRPRLRDPNESVRAFAVRLLINLGDPELPPKMMAILNDPSAEVQRVLTNLRLAREAA